MKNGLKVASFRERLTELVESSEKSKTDIADDLGIAKQTLSAWITGQNSPRRPMTLVIASYFGVTIPWLNGYDVTKYDDNPAVLKEAALPESEFNAEERQLISAWRSADESIKSAVRKLLDISQ